MAYEILKTHFDGLLGRWQGDGLEPIRDTYKNMFNTPVHLFDIYTTRIRINTNPITCLYSLVNTTDEDNDIELRTGIMPCKDNIVHTSVFDNSIHSLMDESTFRSYVNTVYNSMVEVVSMDRMYASDNMANSHPYMTYIKCCPFYFTYHHIITSFTTIGNIEDTFKNILEKYIVDGEGLDIVYKSISSNRYTTDPERIYAIMTNYGSVELFS